MKFLCRVLPHQRLRDRVWHDSVDYRTECGRCNADLIRVRGVGWRPFDPVKDASPHRLDRAEAIAHPPIGF